MTLQQHLRANSTLALHVILSHFRYILRWMMENVMAGLRGMRDVKVPSLFIFISNWIIKLPLGHTLDFKLGMGALYS